MRKEKVIIDTDIGDFIDDTLALYFTVHSKEIELVGVTTVFKNVTARAKLASNVLRTMGVQEIPLVPGLKKPIKDGSISTLYERIDTHELPNLYSEDMNGEKIITEINAVEFIAGTLANSKETVTLIAIGPLTNIASLIINYPNVCSKIKRVIIMGGAYYMNRIEYNVMCDPEAAKVVFESGLDILCVGLDVTSKCQLTENDINYIKNRGTKTSKYLYELITNFIKNTHHLPCLHDPLAIATIINPGLVTLEARRIGVECNGEFTRGMTFNLSNTRWWEQSSTKCNVMVCKDVDREQFISLFLDRVLSDNIT